MAGTFASRTVLGQPPRPKVRAAVVIGVDKAGNLPVLRGAASGAQMVASWLAAEGFEVTLFVDDGKPVRADQIFEAVAELVGRGTLEQLVVYFSGHGFLNGYSEHWMLSRAPDNPNEAVSLVESVVLAKESAIPNVVFISDACRSTPDSLRAGRVRGSLIFPNRGVSRGARTDVDLFLAALPGDPAFEVPVAESTASFEGIYTASFLDAFKHPDDAMVRIMNGVPVVPNNRLRPYLEREVPKRAQANSIKLNQNPDTQVMSGETSYIARVAVSAPTPPPSSQPGPTVVDVAGVELARLGANVLDADFGRAHPEAITRVAAETGFTAAKSTIVDAPGVIHFETQTGFSVSGARVVLAATNPKMRTKVLTQGGDAREPALVRVEPGDQRAGSVALQFADGSGTVIAAFEGYIGTVVVDGQGVSNVSYVPSRNNWRWSDYQHTLKHLTELQAVVATAARFGVFRIEGERETRTKRARQLADRIRILKGIDPTLGLYAAYAYADADLIDQVRSVRSFMREDLRADLFDVAMLSGILSGRPPNDGDRPVPFCPMLSQGWSLLRVKDVRLQPEVDAARDHLRPALWTTFDREGMQILLGALQEGRLR